MFEQLKGRRVQPLQIVQEKCKRVLGPGERTQEPAEYYLEAVLRVLKACHCNWMALNDPRT
jgi:hypothetical protein